ncbi:hypothetical protein MIND_00651900 [Mycena indigotica]|uniref:Uncharacterized protein n=1 Tax=Mycena indigotica TaxID=2126181 RepID=A0A8H6SQY0_9AGAR|nr:uncharacterized protein MIND_00651900 [Mycena indigotica]KAF7304198.1 hypothetical protein MIND_00651900 [Mycena indigotica]
MMFLLPSTAPRSVSSNVCNDLNDCRRLFDIVWGCLITIFLCIWVSVHPNVPPPSLHHPEKDTSLWSRTRWRLFDASEPLVRRMKLMAVALIAPELIIGFASRQLLMARRFSRMNGVSLAHGFFFVMGGFVDVDGHPIVTENQLNLPGVLEAICAVPESAIRDKSKGDIFSKGIAFCQGLWFIVQCLARGVQHLPLTELEVATLAFATINALTWLLWVDKPLDVQDPLTIQLRTSPEADSDSMFSPNPQAPARHVYPASIPWQKRFEAPISNIYQVPSHYNPLTNTFVPTFWCADPRDSGTQSLNTAWSLTFVGQLLCGAVFGAIHCASWSTTFPSVAEMWLWRASTIIIIAMPLALLLVTVGANVIEVLPDSAANVLLLIISMLYCIARGLLLGLPLSTLRELPAGAFCGYQLEFIYSASVVKMK